MKSNSYLNVFVKYTLDAFLGKTFEMSELLYFREGNTELQVRWTISVIPFALGEVEVKLRPTVSRPVCLGVRHPSGTRNQFFLLEILFRQLRLSYFVAPSPTRGRVCNLLHNCFWALPEQSLLGRSFAELTAIFYCLI
jgi:hypothetical protein